MLNSIKVGNFIMEKCKALGLTQQQLADKLNVSFRQYLSRRMELHILILRY